MYRSVFASIVIIASVLFMVANASADRVDKAQEAGRAQMWSKAIGILKKEIDENPGNTKAHYLLGTYYLKQCDNKTHREMGFVMVTTSYMDAVKRFNSAMSLDSSYQEKVRERILDTVRDSLQEGDLDNAARIAKNIDKHLQVKIGDRATELFVEQGEDLLKYGQFTQGHKRLKMARRVGYPSEKIADIYAEYAEKSNNPRVKIYLLDKARKTSNKERRFDIQLGKAMIERAESFSDTEKKEKWFRKAASYLPAENGLVKIGEDYLVVKLERGKEVSKTFNLDKGKKTPWILIPEDYHFKFRFSNSKDVFYYGNGEKIIIPDDDLIKLEPAFKKRYEAIENGTEIEWTFKRKEN
jgi:tetratricopeptide (TPR) repeat protein